MKRMLFLKVILCLVFVTIGDQCWAADDPSQRNDKNGKTESSALFPPELVTVLPYSPDDPPILTGRGKGHWDERIRERGWILREGDGYRMWYTGFEDSPQSLKRLGYATSQDGLTWKRHPQNPLYDRHWVEDMMVVKHDETYYMFAEGKADQAHLLTSSDGIHWERQRPLDVRYTNGQPLTPGPYGTPTGWIEDGTWHLLYERRDLGIWLATSKDLKVWTHVQDEPVLKPGPHKYDRDQVAVNQIVKHNGRYYAYYHGAAFNPGKKTLWTTNVAVSDDLIDWTKYPGNPLFPAEENKSSGILVHDGKQYRLYTMHDKVHVHFLDRRTQ